MTYPSPLFSQHSFRPSKLRRRDLLSAAALASLFAASPAHSAAQQLSGFRFCIKCSALFNETSGGACPGNGGQQHVAAGFNFILTTGDGGTCFGDTEYRQSFWMECLDCATIYFTKGAKPKICPATGRRHDARDEFCYSLPINRFGAPPKNVETAKAQGGWRYCGKCTAMFFDGDLNNKGVCPAGGAHAALGDHFVLEHAG